MESAIGYPTQEQTTKIQKLAPSEVVDKYKAIDGPNSRPDVIKMIQHYPDWQTEQWSVSRIGSLDWYLSEDPKHISQLLTDRGLHRTVHQVAGKYEGLRKQQQLPESDDTTKIESIIASLAAQTSIPPLIVIPKDRYPNSPESSFIDGVHRSLALYVNFLRTGNNDNYQVLVGKKANLFKRVQNKASSIFS